MYQSRDRAVDPAARPRVRFRRRGREVGEPGRILYDRRVFDVLREVEGALPGLLAQDGWHSLHVTYEPPEVERVWRPFGAHRVLLHRIHPCAAGRPLFHPHPWPSIVKVLAGRYEMGVGHGHGLAEPPVAMTILAGAGTVYAMTDPDAWHFVRPLGEPSLSLMVSGPPWPRAMPRADHPPQGPLAPARVQSLLRTFAGMYPA